MLQASPLLWDPVLCKRGLVSTAEKVSMAAVMRIDRRLVEPARASVRCFLIMWRLRGEEFGGALARMPRDVVKIICAMLLDWDDDMQLQRLWWRAGRVVSFKCAKCCAPASRGAQCSVCGHAFHWSCCVPAPTEEEQSDCTPYCCADCSALLRKTAIKPITLP